ncbi:MAG: ATP-dependent Clp protease adaptor ClpS [Phycisphaerales bacterium]
MGWIASLGVGATVPPMSDHIATQTATQTVTRPHTRRPSMWNVVILDDDEHTYDYVIELLTNVFGHTIEKAFSIAEAIDFEGRGVCATLHLELAELKRDQIIGFGADPRLDESAGPMSAVLEPADSGDDAD